MLWKLFKQDFSRIVVINNGTMIDMDDRVKLGKFGSNARQRLESGNGCMMGWITLSDKFSEVVLIHRTVRGLV